LSIFEIFVIFIVTKEIALVRNYLNITFLMLSMLAISACGNGGSGGTKAEPFSQLKNGALILNNDVSYVDRNNLRFKAFGMHTDGLAYEVNTRKGTMFVAPILSNGEYGLSIRVQCLPK